jgi:hypothetical protein
MIMLSQKEAHGSMALHDLQGRGSGRHQKWTFCYDGAAIDANIFSWLSAEISGELI